MNNIYITLLLACMATALYALYRNDYRKAHSSRDNLFNDCSTLLAEMSQTRKAMGFPILKGNYNDYQVVLEVQVDTLSMRKVPPLWLTVSVIGKCQTQGSLDILVRPQNTEFYSPSWQWDDTLPIPHGWPQHAIVKYDGTPARLDILESIVPELFADEKMKELLVTPTAVRLTYMAKQAERGQYMLMRNAIFDGLPIDRDVVASLLESATAIRKQLEGASPNEC